MRTPCTPLVGMYRSLSALTYSPSQAKKLGVVALVAFASGIAMTMLLMHLLGSWISHAFSALISAQNSLATLSSRRASAMYAELLLAHNAHLFWDFLCTCVRIGESAIQRCGADLVTILVLSLCIIDLAHSFKRGISSITEHKRKIYVTVSHQFAECEQCAHKKNCIKHSFTALKKVAVQCKAERGIDFFALQEEARIALRQTSSIPQWSTVRFLIAAQFAPSRRKNASAGRAS